MSRISRGSRRSRTLLLARPFYYICFLRSHPFIRHQYTTRGPFRFVCFRSHANHSHAKLTASYPSHPAQSEHSPAYCHRYRLLLRALHPAAGLVLVVVVLLHGPLRRGLHSSTYRLNVSVSVGWGVHLGVAYGVFRMCEGVIQGWLGCILRLERLRLS